MIDSLDKRIYKARDLSGPAAIVARGPVAAAPFLPGSSGSICITD